jgi:hypothetical protein
VQHSTAEREDSQGEVISLLEEINCGLTDGQTDSSEDKFWLIDNKIYWKSWSVSFQIEGQCVRGQHETQTASEQKQYNTHLGRSLPCNGQAKQLP